MSTSCWHVSVSDVQFYNRNYVGVMGYTWVIILVLYNENVRWYYIPWWQILRWHAWFHISIHDHKCSNIIVLADRLYLPGDCEFELLIILNGVIQGYSDNHQSDTSLYQIYQGLFQYRVKQVDGIDLIFLDYPSLSALRVSTQAFLNNVPTCNTGICRLFTIVSISICGETCLTVEQ